MNEYFYLPFRGVVEVVGLRALANCCSAAFAHWVRLVSTDCNCVASEGKNILSKSMYKLISAISASIRPETKAVTFGLNSNELP